ncbi:uncharacterized protein K441DRAFT_662039 [Cenococcum geophilum 1.58]|uniref:uncharacterized protein n=1 Tax=Cenococcum geophilum 1.58 TaxID=794803 RepID=UPI00358E1762|nr:hypothetical protein K441DRAFT_662039 [Cenococcum geophilum 1.58]
MESSPDQPSTTTIPSTEPPPPETSPPEAEPSSPLPKSPPRMRALHILPIQRLLTAAKSSDSLLLRLSRLFSTPSGTDSLLCTLSYTLTLLHSLLNHALTARLTSLATSIASKASEALLPGETLITTFPAPPSTQLLAHATTSSKALADLISDYRIFVRLWGLFGIYSWGRRTWTTPLAAGAGRKEKLLRAVTWGQVAACAAYQALENGAYLASKGVLNTAGWSGEVGAKRQARWWVWSCRFWAAHVGLEGVRLGALWYYRRREEDEGKGVGDGEKEEKLSREERRKEDRIWWCNAVSNMAYAPLTVHWSVEEGVVGDAWVGFLGMVAGAVALREEWRHTA